MSVSIPKIFFDCPRLLGVVFPGCKNPDIYSTPGGLINILLPNVTIAAGIILFFITVYYGWRLIQVSGGDHGPQQIARAQAAVTWSILGFLIVVSAYFITQVISTIILGNAALVNPPVLP